MPTKQRRAARGGFPRQRLDAGAAGGLERRLEHQVLGRIAGDEQLGKNHQIGALRGRRLARTPHLLGIAGDVADSRIELRDRDREPIGRTPVHTNDLAPALSRRNQASDRRKMQSFRTYSPATAGIGFTCAARTFLSNSAKRKARSIACSALSRGSQAV